jgi:hypothetical protein
MTAQRPHPQRLSPPAPPGALLKREIAAPRPRLVESDDDPAYLKLVRQCPCLSCGQDPAGDAAHVRMQSGAHNKHGGMAKKPADRWALSLCREHHEMQHKIGERQFWHDLGINPLLVCQRLYAQRSDIVAMRAVVITAISERNK